MMMLKRMLGVLIAVIPFVPLVASAAPIPQSMVPHAAFFSLETRQDTFIDPQIFVPAQGRPGGAGLQNIVAVAGYRNALMTDDPDAQAYNAQGKALGFTLGRWFGARGTVNFDPSDKKPRIATAFAGLVPNGVYSLFEATFAADGTTTFAPLDGAGTANTFTADAQGNGGMLLTAASQLTHANAIVLVYHSDGSAHGTDRGVPGITAHHQLIYRLPR